MLASFMLLVDFNAVSWKGVKFRGRACQRRDEAFRLKNERHLSTITLLCGHLRYLALRLNQYVE
jgi:hypothetical protein